MSDTLKESAEKRRRQRQLNVQWAALQTVRWIVTRLPQGVAVALGAFCGRLARLVCKRQVDDAEVRCVSVLGVGPTIARRIVKCSYANMGRAAVEMLRLPWLVKRITRYADFGGIDNVRRALSDGKGAILLLGHLDNWEIVNAGLAPHFPLWAIGADQRDPRVNELIAELRESTGMTNISKGRGLRGAVSALKRGVLLGALLDQDAKEKGIRLPFLGIEASTPTGAVRLADRFGSPILPVQVVRVSSTKHRVIIYPPVKGSGGEPGTADIAAVTRRCNDIISGWILAHPDQWLLWPYPRWGRPEPEQWRHALSR